jgi:DNA-binding transcriptional MerR regulator
MADAMPIRVLAERSGATIATIKFYLREGLMPRGTVTSATHAVYGEAHVRRLALIRTLTTVGGLSLREVGSVLAAIDAGVATPVTALGAVGRRDGARDPVTDQARSEVDRFVDTDLGWRVQPDAPARDDLAHALLALRRSGREVGVEIFRPYARAAGWLVTEELEAPDDPMRAEGLEQGVVAMVVADAASSALRRMAREHRDG